MEPRKYYQIQSIETWAAFTLILAGMLGFIMLLRYISWPLVDDAAISVAYAQSLFSGNGLRLTPVSQVVEGFSNPLWTLLIGLGIPLHLDLVSYTSFLGKLFAVLSIPLYSAWGPVAEDRGLQIQDAATGTIAASVSSFVCWSGSGMETGLFVFLLGLSGIFFLLEIRRGKGSMCGLSLGLLCLTRPEGLVYVMVAAAIWVTARLFERRLPGRQEFFIALWIVGLVGGYTIFRWFYFAALLPNTYYAKITWEFDWKAYFWNFWSLYKPLCMAVILGFLFSMFGRRAVRIQGALAAGFTASGCFFVYYARGDWMIDWRLLAHVVPCSVVVIAAGLSGLKNIVSFVLPRTPRFSTTVFLIIALITMGGLTWKTADAGIQRARLLAKSPEMPLPEVFKTARLFGSITDRVGIRRSLLGIVDIGGPGMILKNAEIIDLATLADYELARHRLNPAAAEDYLLAEGPPDILDCHGPGGYVIPFRRLRSLYEPTGPHGIPVYKGLTVDTDTRCPGGKANVLSLSADELAANIRYKLENGRADTALMLWRCGLRYQSDNRLPSKSARHSIAKRASELGELFDRNGDLRKAINCFSLAAVIDDGNAHWRRRAESCRERLFPPPPRGRN